MFQIVPLDSLTAGAFQNLIAQTQRYLLLQPLPGLIAFGAVAEGRPIGLAVGVQRPNEPTVQLASLFVDPSFRGQGIGHSLLEALERDSNRLHCRWLVAEMLVEEGNVTAVERFFRSHHFADMESAFYVFSGQLHSLKEMSWFQASKLPADFSLFPWHALTPEERAEIERGIGVWYPPILSPFQEEQSIDRDYSIGLRYKEEVVGWLILQRLAVNRVLFKTMFVKKEFQRMGRGIAMAIEMVRRTQLAKNVPYWVLVVDRQNEAMMQIARRRFASLIQREEVMLRTWKSLSS